MQPYLADPAKTRSVLERHGFFIKKGYGQNFLIRAAVPEGILEAAGIGPEDRVLEIGPGIGTLTQYLAQAAERVIAIEVDRKLEPLLKETLAPWENISLIWGDVMKQDLSALLQDLNVARPVRVVANLPYYITTPILMMLLRQPDLFSDITVMVQKEVGERMAAGPGGKEYGPLSLAVQYYAEPRLVMEVPPAAFLPQPKVSSVVVNLTPRKDGAPACQNENLLFEVIKGAFLQRRKMLPNALAAYGPLGVSREQAVQALTEMDIDPQIRGEKLDLAAFAALTDRLAALRIRKE